MKRNWPKEMRDFSDKVMDGFEADCDRDRKQDIRDNKIVAIIFGGIVLVKLIWG
jgi:hypothetical protein